MRLFLFIVSSLFTLFVAMGKFIGEYWFVMVVLAVHPIIMFN